MIEGIVNAAHETVLTLRLQGQAGHTLEIDAVVDTGFSRFVTLPPATVTELGLAFTGINRVVLADGSEVTVDVYGVTVLWDDQTRDVVAYAADTTPLIGMAMLDRHNLNIEVESGGRVVIQAR